VSSASPLRRPEKCLSDFALDELVAARSLHVEPARESTAHLATCSRCAERLAEFEAVEPPPFAAARPSAKRRRRRRAVSLMYAGFATLLLLGGFGAVRSHVLPIAGDTATPSVYDTTRTKGALSLVVIIRDISGNVRRITPGEVVHPGESLRFELTTAESGYVGVIGLDAAGVTTVYAPAQGTMTSVTGGSPAALPNAIVMDETLGTERLVAVVCREPRSAEQLKTAGERALLAAGGEPTRVRGLALPCGEAVVDLHKQAAQ
jgi:hypothetical protein